MYLLLLQLFVLLPLGKAGRCVDGCQSSFSFVLLERGRRDLHMANPEEGEDKPDLFVAVPHLVGASLAGEGQRQREKMLSRLGRLWKKPETELHSTTDVENDHVSLGIQALTQTADERKVERSPLQEEAKKFWHRFMFRKGPASQGVILPIKSHEVHRETCRTVPFNQVCIVGGKTARVCKTWEQIGQMQDGKRLTRDCALPGPHLVLGYSLWDLAKCDYISISLISFSRLLCVLDAGSASSGTVSLGGHHFEGTVC